MAIHESHWEPQDLGTVKRMARWIDGCYGRSQDDTMTKQSKGHAPVRDSLAGSQGIERKTASKYMGGENVVKHLWFPVLFVAAITVPLMVRDSDREKGHRKNFRS